MAIFAHRFVPRNGTAKHYGAMAERLGKGLQNLLQRFDSASHLEDTPPYDVWRGISFTDLPEHKRETDSNDRDEEVGPDAERGLPPIGTQIRPSFRPDTAKIPKQEGEEPTESGRPSGIWPVRQDSGHASVPAPPNYDGRFAAAACPLHKAASRSSTCTTEASFNITHRSPSSR